MSAAGVANWQRVNEQIIASILGHDLELEGVPDVGHWAMPCNAYLDWQIVEEYLYLAPDALLAYEVAQSIGISGQRMAGRCRALHARGILKRAPRSAVIPYYIDEPRQRAGAAAWQLTAASLRRAGR